MTPDPTWPTPVENPTTHADAMQNLRHVLAIFDDPNYGGPIRSDEFVVVATGSVYGPLQQTGLTWRDLQLLAEEAK